MKAGATEMPILYNRLTFLVVCNASLEQKKRRYVFLRKAQRIYTMPTNLYKMNGKGSAGKPAANG